MADKYINLAADGSQIEVEGLVTSAGAGSDGKIPALDATGKLDNSMMPAGIAADTKSIEASENLAAGDMVNVWLDTTMKCRKADASGASASKRTHGYVLAAVTSGNQATVYFEDTVTGLAGLTLGATYFLDGGTPGGITTTAPTTTGHCVQEVGVAISATELSFEPSKPIIRA